MICRLGLYSAHVSALLLLSALLMFAGQERSAPARRPSMPAQPYVVATAPSIEGIVQELRAANRQQDLINGESIGCRVFIQHEADVSTNQAEVHDAADDVFILLAGSAVFILGGQLDTPKETQPGEWRAPGILGGREFKVNKGDVLMVPRGTPHRRITSGQDVTFMLVKSSAPVKK